MVKYLIEQGSDINQENWIGETPLINACKKGNEAMVKYLIEQGADINKENGYSKTPLLKAFRSGNGVIVKYLVEHGANINKKKNVYGETLLSIVHGKEEKLRDFFLVLILKMKK